MKKITYLLAFCLVALSINLSAQDRILKLTNFEDGSVFFDEKGPELTMDVVDNPFSTGINTSSKVLKITGTAEHDNTWEALYTKNDKTTLTLDINETDGYRYLHFKTYKDFNSQMLWGFYPDFDNDGVLDDFKLSERKSNSIQNAWEYIVVDLLWLKDTWNISEGTYYRIHFEMTSKMDPRVAFTGYIDDIYLSSSKDEISDIGTGVDEKEISKNVSVSRTTNGKFVINTSAELKETAKLDIYNMQGQLIQSLWKSRAGESFEINLPTTGLYILRVSEGSEAYIIKF